LAAEHRLWLVSVRARSPAPREASDCSTCFACWRMEAGDRRNAECRLGSIKSNLNPAHVERIKRSITRMEVSEGSNKRRARRETGTWVPETTTWTVFRSLRTVGVTGWDAKQGRVGRETATWTVFRIEAGKEEPPRDQNKVVVTCTMSTDEIIAGKDGRHAGRSLHQRDKPRFPCETKSPPLLSLMFVAHRGHTAVRRSRW
jgi:hypothetical protein